MVRLQDVVFEIRHHRTSLNSEIPRLSTCWLLLEESIFILFLLYVTRMYSSQAGVMQVAPRSSAGSSAKDHAVPEQTADALGYLSGLKACFRIVAETLSSIRSTDEDHKLQGVST